MLNISIYCHLITCHMCHINNTYDILSKMPNKKKLTKPQDAPGRLVWIEARHQPRFLRVLAWDFDYKLCNIFDMCIVFFKFLFMEFLLHFLKIHRKTYCFTKPMSLIIGWTFPFRAMPAAMMAASLMKQAFFQAAVTSPWCIRMPRGSHCIRRRCSHCWCSRSCIQSP